MNPFRRRRGTVFTPAIVVGVLLALVLGVSGCAGMPINPADLIPFELFPTPTPPPPTPTPTPTNTPLPTPTPKPGETPLPPTATPIPTPQVSIPQGFVPVADTTRGYSLAVPPDWSPLDLRSAQFQQMANTFGMGGQLQPLNDFLNSPQGDQLGVIYVTDLMSAMFGGLPTALVVFEIDAPGATPQSLLI